MESQIEVLATSDEPRQRVSRTTTTTIEERMADQSMRTRVRIGRLHVTLFATALLVLPMTARAQTQPKVPFNNDPCQALTATDQATLKIQGPIQATPDKAPANLKSDNICAYTHGGTRVSQIGFMTKADYDANNNGNRSKTHQAPADLPGAFYDGQGGLWIAKNGYYVVLAGKSALREPIAKLLAGKL
jgi:hypothetical protein